MVRLLPALCALSLSFFVSASVQGKAKGAGPVPKPPSASPPKAKEPPKVREILLTFDDGPRLDLTPKVLDMLDARGIKAVFFVNGWRFQGKGPERDRARAMLRDMMRRGHLVGNHTVHHYFLCGKRGPTIAAKEIEDNAILIEEAIGMRPLLFRTPYGAHCPTLAATLKELAIRPIAWDIDPQDWKLRDPEKILQYMKDRLVALRGRSIVLFHDVQPATVEMLPDLLTWIDKQNETFRERKEPEIKYIDYGYLLPNYPIVPPIFDALGRLVVESVRSFPLPAGFFRMTPLAYFPEGVSAGS